MDCSRPRVASPSRVPTVLEEMAAMRECVIFDLDGTFAFLGDRSPYDASRAEHDEINQAVHFVYEAIRRGWPVLEFAPLRSPTGPASGRERPRTAGRRPPRASVRRRWPVAPARTVPPRASSHRC